MLTQIEKQRAYSKKWEENNKEKRRIINGRWQKKNREKLNKIKRDKNLFVSEWKTNLGCSICGYNKYGGALELHHFYNKKFRLAPHMLWSLIKYNSKKIKREMKKCVLLCRNCHKEVEFNLFPQKFIFEKFIEFQNKIKNIYNKGD